MKPELENSDRKKNKIYLSRNLSFMLDWVKSLGRTKTELIKYKYISTN